MLARLTRLSINRPKLILLCTMIVILVGGTLASGIMDRLTAGGYERRGSESHEAQQVLENTLGQGAPNLVLVITDKRGADDPAVAAAGQTITQRLQQEKDVTSVASYWSQNRAQVLRNKSGDKALVLARINGDFDNQIERVEQLAATYSGTVQGVQARVGGDAMSWHENIAAAEKDISKAESVAFPLTLVMLVLIFGSVIAALLPLAVAFITIMVTTGLMFLFTFTADTSNFVFNIAVFTGMGLAIDYSLLVVSRYREELHKGLAIDDAIMTAVRTAGRTVVFSAVTVAVAFLAVLVFPFTFILSLAAAAIVTALTAALGSVTVVPALLKLLGPKIDKWQWVKRKQRPASAVETGFWHRTAVFVMRRPISVGLLVVAFILLLGAPVVNLDQRMPDEQILPTSAESYKVAQTLRGEFDTRETMAIQVVSEHAGNPAAKTAEIGTYAQQLSTIKNVTRVESAAGTYLNGRQTAPPNPATAQRVKGDATYLTVIPAVDGYSGAGADVVRDVRDVKPPFEVVVGGLPAVSVDSFDGLYGALPLAVLILILGMFVLLFLLTGSVVLPIVAMVMTMLSLSATLGAIVFVFQDGHLQWLIGDFVVTGSISWTVPITIFAMAFGLSMDYQVFMLSRIKEEYDKTGDNTAAVAAGLERTGRIVTYAAFLISIVFAAWITSGLSYMKAFGLGLPLAILMDATLIRGILLPATMKLLGPANWWAPGWMKAVHRRYGLHELEAPAVVPPTAPPVEARTGR